jgi:hypothetical protein
MNREFTRKELYDLVWSQPMKTVAASVGISDVQALQEGQHSRSHARLLGTEAGR